MDRNIQNFLRIQVSIILHTLLWSSKWAFFSSF